MEKNDHIYMGIGSHVVCLDKDTGTELWRTKLKWSSLTTLTVVEDVVVAYASGALFGLSRKDGAILWQNGLKGLGFCTGIIASGSEGSATLQSSVVAASHCSE